MILEEELIAIKPMQKPYVNITWQVSDFCNYKCSYCNPGNWAGKNKKDDGFEEIVANLKIIIDNYKARGYEGFKFYFSGGEPTVWPHLIPLINWLKIEIDDPHIGINTNLSRATKWWEEHYQLFHDIVASFHIDFADQERYLDNLVFLQDKVNYLCSRMMMQEDRFQEVIDFGAKVKNILQNYNIEWVPLFDELSVNAGPWEYSEQWMVDFFTTHSFESQQLLPKPRGSKRNASSKEVYASGKELALNGNRLVAERRNFFSGWKCHVDEALFIDTLGNITAASCGQGPKLGNIYTEIELITKPIICAKTQCTCGTDIMITKEKE
jgi:organic radical activating enzyme